jgi:hypothetical protein
MTVPATLSALATRLDAAGIERAINEADKRNLITPPALRRAIDGDPRAAALRRVLDRRAFVLTESELERLFLPVAEAVTCLGGRAPVRFTHEQIRYEPDYVGATLATIALKLSRPGDE